jgi:hypothetical protein
MAFKNMPVSLDAPLLLQKAYAVTSAPNLFALNDYRPQIVPYFLTNLTTLPQLRAVIAQWV